MVFPNPYFLKTGDDLRLRFDATQNVKKVKLRIYSSGLRRVREKIWDGVYTAGRVDMQVAIKEFDKLANGTYYYVVIGENDSGQEAKSRPEAIIILK
jgi:hypothetical protein